MDHILVIPFLAVLATRLALFGHAKARLWRQRTLPTLIHSLQLRNLKPLLVRHAGHRAGRKAVGLRSGDAITVEREPFPLLLRQRRQWLQQVLAILEATRLLVR